MKQESGRSLTLAYVVALAIVAVTSFLSHMALERVMKEHEGAAAVVNLSGRQRSLSQRIASLSAQVALGVPGAGADLATTIDQFERAHAVLIFGGGPDRIAPAQDPALRALYFEGPHPLDAAVRTYVALAREVAGLPPSDPRFAPESRKLFAEAREPLLRGLNEVVTFHQTSSEAQLRSLERLQTVSLAVVVVTLLAEALLIFRPMVNRIRRTTLALMRLASTDFLTGVLNRRSFHDRATAEIGRAARGRHPTALLMLDADRFKAINDTHGHAVGDVVLQALAAALGATLRTSDVVGRIGGEEFVALLPETGLAEARLVAERCRERIADRVVPTPAGDVRFTVSIGVDVVDPGEPTAEACLARADEALYAAKAGGRNRVEAAAPRATGPVAVAA